MTAQEKTLYKEAVTSAVKSGEFLEFTKIHMEKMSEKQAHSTCAFLLWHKRYLLAYENMLRAQGAKYACVTVPFWDVMKDYASMIDGKCKDIYSCSKIVQELGGTMDEARDLSRTVLGVTVSGPCYSTVAGSAYCDDYQQCGCLPRGDLTMQLPSSCDYSGLFNNVAYSASFEEFTQNLQNGIHNEVHSVIGGFMATFTSPADTLFWSWHATVDMMLYIYHQCHVATAMSDSEIRQSVYGFSQSNDCRYSSDAPKVNTKSQIIQQSANKQGVMFSASKNEIIGKYFASLPEEIAEYISYRPDGKYGYTYEIPEAFNKQLLQSESLCRTYWQEWTKRSSVPAPTSAPSTGGKTKAPPKTRAPPKSRAPKTQSPDAGDDGNGKVKPGDFEESTKKPTKDSASSLSGSTDGDSVSVGDLPKTKTPKPTKKADAVKGSSNGADDEDAAGSLPDGFIPGVGTPEWADGSYNGSSLGDSVRSPCHVISDGDFSAKSGKYWTWYGQCRKNLETVFPGNITEIARQMEYVGCMTFGSEFGIKNFTDEFVTNFRIQDKRPICQKRVEEVKEGKCEVVVETKKFSAEAVQILPGVTPKPAVDPDAAYQEYKHRVSLESGHDNSKKSSNAATTVISVAVTMAAAGIALLM
ncbi:hypothetical protein P43SY_003298 [Pythium insidiosum]|uniref:Tyrosinase copper-binding domain-containing protein n=1 Tax=Pythium insidiosum TaxID=114742 RepID=A0AAD5LBU8_PYTIN|nr:hypothetical protein P43SY_003298 [Pythium insidiosum]KAJ0397989.1 hypothetical protein ATCC90586_006681 [Pythium insidiosum]